MRGRQSTSQVLVNGNEGDESNSPEISESDDNEDLDYVVEILDARYVTKEFEFLCKFSNSKSLEWIPRSQCNNPYAIRKFFDNRREQMLSEDANERVEAKNEECPSTSSVNIDLTDKPPLMKVGRCSTIIQPEDSQPSTPSSNEEDTVECLSMENKIDGIHYTFGQKNANQKTIELAVNELSNETNKNYMQKALSFSLNKVFDAQLEFRNTGIVVHSSKEQTNFTADSVMDQLSNGQPKSNSTSPKKFFREESNGKLEEIIRRLPRRSEQLKDVEVLTVKSPEKVEELRRSPRKSEQSEDVEILMVKSPPKVEEPMKSPQQIEEPMEVEISMVKSPPKVEEPMEIEELIKSPQKIEEPIKSPPKTESTPNEEPSMKRGRKPKLQLGESSPELSLIDIEFESETSEEEQTPKTVQLNGPKKEEKLVDDATPVKIAKTEEPSKESPSTSTKFASDVAPITPPQKARQVPDLNLKTAFTPTKKRLKLMEKARAARLLKKTKKRQRPQIALATLSEVRKQQGNVDQSSSAVEPAKNDETPKSNEISKEEHQLSTSNEVKIKDKSPQIPSTQSYNKKDPASLKLYHIKLMEKARAARNLKKMRRQRRSKSTQSSNAAESAKNDETSNSIEVDKKQEEHQSFTSTQSYNKQDPASLKLYRIKLMEKARAARLLKKAKRQGRSKSTELAKNDETSKSNEISKGEHQLSTSTQSYNKKDPASLKLYRIKLIEKARAARLLKKMKKRGRKSTQSSSAMESAKNDQAPNSNEVDKKQGEHQLPTSTQSYNKKDPASLKLYRIKLMEKARAARLLKMKKRRSKSTESAKNDETSNSIEVDKKQEEHQSSTSTQSYNKKDPASLKLYRIKLMEKARAARLLKKAKRQGRSKSTELAKNDETSNSTEVDKKQGEHQSSTSVKRIGRPPKDSKNPDNKQDDSQGSNEISIPNGSINKFKPNSTETVRRGRPPKDSSFGLEQRRESSLASLTSTTSNPETLIKKRSRPFLNPTNSTASSDNNQASSSQSTSNNSQTPQQRSLKDLSSSAKQVDSAPIEHRRGRPPLFLKNKREGSLASLTSTTSNPETFVRKRGRPSLASLHHPSAIIDEPRKRKLPDSVTKQDEVPKKRGFLHKFLQQKREGSLASLASTSSNPEVRKRGRPFKNLSFKHPTNNDSQSQVPKKLGRPFKTLSFKHPTNNDSQSQVPKKLGRPCLNPKGSLNFNSISLLSQGPKKRGRPSLLFNLKRRKAGLTSTSTQSENQPLVKKIGRPFKTLSFKHPTNKDLPTSSKEPKKRGRKPRLAEGTTAAQEPK